MALIDNKEELLKVLDSLEERVKKESQILVDESLKSLLEDLENLKNVANTLQR